MCLRVFWLNRESLLGTVRGASYHNWRAEEPAPELTVNCWATDGSGTIGGVENGSNILGVQFHPEVDDKLPEIFQFLMEE